jgi:hypothetical protein
MALSVSLSLLLAFSIFSFGAIENWSSALFQVSAFTLAALVARRNEGFFRFPRRLWAPFLFAVGLACIGLIQVVPLRPKVWRSLGDERGAISQKAAQAEALLRSEPYRTNPFIKAVLPKDAGPLRTPPEAPWIPASFTPVLTLRAVWAILAALAILLLLEHMGKQANGALNPLGLTAGFLGLFVGFAALVQYRPGVEKVIGLVTSVHAKGAFGPFINENNGMGFVNIAFCLLYYAVGRTWTREKRAGNRLGLGVMGAILFAVHVTLLLIRTSGAGMWTFFLLPAAAALHLLRHKPKIAAGLAVLGAVGLGAATWFTVSYKLMDFHGRMETWWNSLQQDHWVVGNGLQSFSERFNAVLTDMPLNDPNWWLFPENEYVQLAFEGGIVGLVLALFGVGYVLWLGWRAILAEGTLFLLVPALWGEMAHAVTDFQFHFWPVAFAYLILIATIVISLGRRNHRSTPGRSGHPPGRGAKNLPLLDGGMGVAAAHSTASPLGFPLGGMDS